MFDRLQSSPTILVSTSWNTRDINRTLSCLRHIIFWPRTTKRWWDCVARLQKRGLWLEYPQSGWPPNSLLAFWVAIHQGDACKNMGSPVWANNIFLCSLAWEKSPSLSPLQKEVLFCWIRSPGTNDMYNRSVYVFSDAKFNLEMKNWPYSVENRCMNTLFFLSIGYSPTTTREGRWPVKPWSTLFSVVKNIDI